MLELWGIQQRQERADARNVMAEACSREQSTVGSWKRKQLSILEDSVLIVEWEQTSLRSMIFTT